MDPPSFSFCYFLLTYPDMFICIHMQTDELRSEHKLVHGSFHSFACCCVWLLWCSRLPGETGRWRSKFDVGLGLFDQGQNYANPKEAAAVCRHLRCGSMCWYMHEPDKQLIPKTDKNTTNVNIVYSTLDQSDNLLAYVRLFESTSVCVSVRGLIIWTRWARVGVV